MNTAKDSASTRETITVELGDRSYPIIIGDALLGGGLNLSHVINGEQVMVVSNSTVAPLYMETLTAALTGYSTATVILPDGEEYKTTTHLQLIYDALLSAKFDRNATIIALGGGVVGDMAGFAAATYQRGIPFIQVPTTLLAQVDSSVGGKTGVNHPLGKNMIGAFYQPKCVIADTSTLNTLDDRQLKAGVAEVIKYGAIRDKSFFVWLESNVTELLSRNPQALAYAIERSCENKAEIVAADEHEQGVRAILNLGHTFGHAIETATGYSEWLHGEAIAVGMCMAVNLSKRLGWLDEVEGERIVSLIEKTGLPTSPPENMTAEQFIELMSVDKKVEHGQLRLVLLESLGGAVVTANFKQELLMEILTEACC